MSAHQNTRFAFILHTHDLFVKRSAPAEGDLTLFQCHHVYNFTSLIAKNEALEHLDETVENLYVLTTVESFLQGFKFSSEFVNDFSKRFISCI